MEFQDLCTFETFQQFWSHYGYEGKLEDVIEQEFSRTKGKKTFDYVFEIYILYITEHFINLCVFHSSIMVMSKRVLVFIFGLSLMAYRRNLDAFYFKSDKYILELLILVQWSLLS